MIANRKLKPDATPRTLPGLCSLPSRMAIAKAGLLLASSKFVLAVLVSLVLPAGVSHAIEKGNTLLILDASGSMWGRVEGRSKIETARDVLVDLLATTPAERQLGLMSYGHRRKGDCADIQLLVPPASNTRSAIQSAVKSIKPKGKTPLSASVIQAARTLRSDRNKATVILVSDGRETCDYDPCQVAKELEASSVDFTAHVIGFNVANPLDRAQLRCMAENTGGQFIAANNGAELSSALQAVSDLFGASSAGGQAAGNAVANGPNNANSNEGNSNEGNANGIAVDTGDLEVALSSLQQNSSDTAWNAAATAEDRLEAESSGIRRELPADRGGADRQSRSSASRSPAKNDRLSARQQRQLEQTQRAQKQRKQKQDPKKQGDDAGTVVELPASSVVNVAATLKAPLVIYTLQLFTVEWTGPAAADDLITISRPDSAATSSVVAASIPSSKSLKLKAPEEPGEYELRYISADKRILVSRRITVRKAEAELIAPDRVHSGRLVRIRWKGGTRDPKDSIVISRKGAPLSSSVSRGFIRGQSSVMLRMPRRSGDYELRYMQAGGNLIASQPIEVK